MALFVPRVLAQLDRVAAGEALSAEEEAELRRAARTLRGRLERLRAVCPDAGVELGPEVSAWLEASAAGTAR